MDWVSGPSHKILSHSSNQGQGRNQRGKKTASKHKEAENQRQSKRTFLKEQTANQEKQKGEREGAKVDLRERVKW